MKDLLERYSPVRNTDPGAGGGAPPPPSDPGAGGAGGGSPTPPAQPYRPEGLAEQYAGTTDRETIDKLYGTVKGYRDRDAARDVPETPEGYLNLEGLKDFKLDDAMKPYFEQLKDDKAAQAMFAEARARGFGRQDTLALWQTGMKAMADAGMLEPPLDVKAERAALLPETHRNASEADQNAAIEARLKANEDFVTLLTQPGADGKAPIAKEDAEHALLMLMDSAKGNRFLEAFRAIATKSGLPQPSNVPGSPGGGGLSAEGLRARMALPENQPSNRKFSQASYDQLQADYKRFYGE